MALGALATALPAFAQAQGLPALDSFRLTLGAYGLAGVALAALFARLSPAVEPVATMADYGPGCTTGPAAAPRRRWRGLHRSQGIVARFATLLALNSFAAGFVVQSFVAYWFQQRFGTGLATLGVLCFCTQVAGALSYPVAARIAGRIGLVNTMVFTHLPSNVLLLLVPAMPSFEPAAAVLVARHALSQMDRPACESSTMAMVAPDERTAAASYISVATDLAAAASLALTGIVLQVLAPGLPFVIAGALRCAYNGTLYLTFRDVRPPEERPAEERPAEERPAEERPGSASRPGGRRTANTKEHERHHAARVRCAKHPHLPLRALVRRRRGLRAGASAPRAGVRPCGTWRYLATLPGRAIARLGPLRKAPQPVAPEPERSVDSGTGHRDHVLDFGPFRRRNKRRRPGG